MSLPQINNTATFIKIPLPNGKKIGVRPWIVLDEKNLMFTIESEVDSVENKLPHIIDFLRKCVNDTALFDTLGESSLKKVLIESRKLAKGDVVEYSIPCPECKRKLIDEVHISEDEVIKSFDFSPTVVNDKLSIVFKEIPFDKQLELQKKYEGKPIQYDYYYLINSIEGITYDNQLYTTFNEEEMDEFISQLSPIELTKIVDEFDEKKAYVYLNRKIICDNEKCKAEVVPNFGDLFHFLVF